MSLGVSKATPRGQMGRIPWGPAGRFRELFLADHETGRAATILAPSLDAGAI